MTPQPTAASAGDVRTPLTEARHRHNSACYWDVDECRWQRVTYPLVGYALGRCSAIGRPVTHTGPATGP